MQVLATLGYCLYPPRCAACARACGAPLCPPCHESLDVNDPACPRCGEPSAVTPSRTCPRCLASPPPFAMMVAPWRYGGALAVATKRLKYGGEVGNARRLAELLAPYLRGVAAASGALSVVPVPNHWRRRVRRGFDQTVLLAEMACRLAGLPRGPLLALRRVRHTPASAGSTFIERQRRVNAAFAATARTRRLAPTVVLLDDVVTSGATMRAAAGALADAGAEHIVAMCLARAEST